MENVDAMVIGRHSDSMIPLGRYSTVSGVPATALLPADRLEGGAAAAACPF